MPIKIPNQLPATHILQKENIFVMTETRAITQDIRPLQILLLNLMPTKVDTETQLARVLGNTPLQIQLELIAPSGHISKNTSQEHMLAFYKTFDEVKDRTFDGLIITGGTDYHGLNTVTPRPVGAFSTRDEMIARIGDIAKARKATRKKSK